MAWQYEKGEHRHKHNWSNDFAGFLITPSGIVGKCPNNITLEQATQLLNEGIPFFNRRKPVLDCGEQGEFPHAIYAVYQGVAYRAVPTLGCCSYHAFPEIEFPPTIEAQLLARARQQSLAEEKALKKWLKQWRQKAKTG